MTREHAFVDAESVVVVPRPPTRAERERQSWSDFVIQHLHDEVVTDVGYGLDSLYVEWFWLPIVGPSSICMARNLLRRDHGSSVALDELAAELGLKPTVAVHTLERLVRFGVLLRSSSSVFVRTHLSPLGARQLEMLPAHLREVEEYYEEPGS